MLETMSLKLDARGLRDLLAEPDAAEGLSAAAGTPLVIVEVGWWPGDARHPKAAFFAYAYPAPPGFAGASLSPAGARWNEALGEYILDWDEVRVSADPRAAAVEFAQSAFRHACLVCDWDTQLAASADGQPPPVR